MKEKSPPALPNMNGPVIGLGLGVGMLAVITLMISAGSRLVERPYHSLDGLVGMILLFISYSLATTAIPVLIVSAFLAFRIARGPTQQGLSGVATVFVPPGLLASVACGLYVLATGGPAEGIEVLGTVVAVAVVVAGCATALFMVTLRAEGDQG